MQETLFVLFMLLVVVVILSTIAPRIGLPYPILLVVGGSFLGFVPGLPTIKLDPELVFLFFLPPLLYSSAISMPLRDFRANLRPISLLAFGLVFVTMAFVAVIAHVTIPGLSWAMAFTLGAIVSPTDTVAPASIGHRLGLPHKIMVILEGESLINDATALVALRFASAAVVTGLFSPTEAIFQFFIVDIGGTLLGLLIGVIIGWLRRSINDASVEILVTLLTPFAAYWSAEAFHLSGVLATVAAGIYLGWHGPGLLSADTRLQANAVWRNIVFILNGLLFTLVGLELHSVFEAIADSSLLVLAWYGLVVSLAVIMIRIVYVFTLAYFPRSHDPLAQEHASYPPWRGTAIIAWTGLRGAVSLAAALSLPLVIDNGSPFPERDLIIFLTFCVILVTLVFQGLSLPALIRTLDVRDTRSTLKEERRARLAVTRAAINRLEQLVEEEEASEEEVAPLIERYERRLDTLTKYRDKEHREIVLSFRNLQNEALQAERTTLIKLRNEGEISDNTLRRVEHELDLEEQRQANRLPS